MVREDSCVVLLIIWNFTAVFFSSLSLFQLLTSADVFLFATGSPYNTDHMVAIITGTHSYSTVLYVCLSDIDIKYCFTQLVTGYFSLRGANLHNDYFYFWYFKEHFAANSLVLLVKIEMQHVYLLWVFIYCVITTFSFKGSGYFFHHCTVYRSIKGNVLQM